MPSTRDNGLKFQRPKKLIITASDVMLIMNCHRTTANRILKTIKIGLKKQDHHLVTISEFAAVFGLTEEAIHQFLK